MGTRPFQLMAAALLCSSLASAQEPPAGQELATVEATGEAPVVKGDEVKALDEAVRAALRAAVEQVAGVTLEAQTQTLNSVLVRDQVVARTQGYVKRHEVVARKVERGVLSVKVRAQVGKSELSKDVEAARALVGRFGRPSLVILIQEQTMQVDQAGKPGGVTSSDVTATVLTKAFKDDGWDIRDPAFAAGKVRLAPGASLGGGEAKELGDLSKAAYVLYGTTTMRNQQLDGSLSTHRGVQQLFPVTGEYDLALFATDSGTQLAKISGKLDAQPLPEAPKKLPNMLLSYERTAHDLIHLRAARISGPVRQAALEHFRDRELNGADYAVAASGLGNYAAAQELRQALEALPGVKGVEQQEFKGGVGAYRVTFRGSAGALAEAVGRATFRKKRLEVTEVSGNKVVLAVAR